MLIARPVVPLLLAALLLGCGNLGIQTQLTPGTDFTGMRHWSFAPVGTMHEGVRLDPDLMDAQVAGEVRTLLEGGGFTEVAPEEADFWVGYKGMLERRTATGQFEGEQTPGRSAWASGGSQRTYLAGEAGSLELVMFTPRTTDVLWRGRATATVTPDETDVERVARVREAVRRMLADFPPPAGEAAAGS